MPFEISWLAQDSILYQRYFGCFDINDLNSVQSETQAHLAHVQGTHFVHILLDLRDLHQIDLTLKQISSTIHRNEQDNLGWTVLVLCPDSRVTPFIKMLGAAASRLFDLRYRAFDNYDHALDFILTMDQHLNQLVTAQPA
ncbi:MAG: hypothetical protein HC915_08310 [Anaerolineae bacterium]|nr:hypothetical protein [Anaerolineae bacterium]